jgi:ABC-2 type transport system permease protein
MNINKTLTVTKTSLTETKWGKFLVCTIIVPMIIIAVIAYSFQGFGSNITLNIVNLDQGSSTNSAISISNTILTQLSNSSTLNINTIYTTANATSNSLDTCLDQLHNGEIDGIIVFRSNFTNDVLLSVANQKTTTQTEKTTIPTTIELYIDNTDPQVGSTITGQVQSYLQLTMVSQYHITPAVTIKSTAVYGANTNMLDYVGPGFACLFAAMLGFMLPGVFFMSDAPKITKKINPQPSNSELICGYLIYSSIIAAVQSATIALTLIMFPIQMNGSPFTVFLTIFLLTLVFQALSLVAVTLVKGNPNHFMLFIPLLLVPSIVLSGLVMPIFMVGPILQPFAYIHPLTYAINACREVMINGWGLGDIWFQLTILMVFELVIITSTVVVLNWKNRKNTTKI